MAINERAPVVSKAQVTVNAPASIVWETISTIDEWPRWNKDIRSAKLEGPLAPGSTFRWRSGPGEITSTLREVRPSELIEWEGRSFGVRAIHLWRLRPEGDDTVVEGEESWDGAPVRLFRGKSQKTRRRRRPKRP